MPLSRENLVILKGTHDPTHNGHLDILQAGQEHVGAKKGLLVPKALVTHKAGVLSIDHRFNMAHLAAQTRKDIEAMRIGVKMTTRKLLENLKKFNPDSKIHLLMGDDVWEFMKKSPDFIRNTKDLCEYLVSPRTSIFEELQEDVERTAFERGIKATTLKPTLSQFSSKHIKENIHDAPFLARALPAPVIDYIFENGLYGCLEAPKKDNALNRS